MTIYQEVKALQERSLQQHALMQVQVAGDLIIACNSTPIEVAITNNMLRSCQEPSTGRCDAVVTVPFVGFRDVLIGSTGISHEDADILISKLAIITRSCEGTFTIPEEEYVLVDSPATTSNRQQNEDPIKPATSKTNQFSPLDASLKTFLDNTTAPIVQHAPDEDLHFPLCLIHHKKKHDTSILKANNQAKTGMVSAITFLARLGISDFPIFSVVTEGAKGTVFMGWHSSKEDVCSSLPSLL